MNDLRKTQMKTPPGSGGKSRLLGGNGGGNNRNITIKSINSTGSNRKRYGVKLLSGRKKKVFADKGERWSPSRRSLRARKKND